VAGRDDPVSATQLFDFPKKDFDLPPGFVQLANGVGRLQALFEFGMVLACRGHGRVSDRERALFLAKFLAPGWFGTLTRRFVRTGNSGLRVVHYQPSRTNAEPLCLLSSQ